jgi:protein-tyrosine phosphatase
MLRVLFVCMGNICRSPSAQGVFSHLVIERGLAHAIETDSAGTHAYHLGEPPDPRARQAAASRGIDLSPLRARQVTEDDFRRFDLVLAMDRDNLRHLQRLSPDDARLRLLLDFAPHLEERDVPDPYYGGAAGFERVLDMIEIAAEGVLEELEARLSARR